jgi:N-sulfoglucosamine sulfohydrolase
MKLASGYHSQPVINLMKPIFTSLAACMLVCTQVLASAGRPNILWITCEDISPYLGSYGCPEAQTPNLDKLARNGLRFTRAYANAPVCAVARSTLLTGMYASTTGTHHMRCRTQLPEIIPAYPRLLRQAGYYCTNNSKKDYNSNFESDPKLWNESSDRAHWKNRKPGQPFFAVFNLGTTHESQLNPARIREYVSRRQIPGRPRIDPNSIGLPPYHPDLPKIREDWARLHDLITCMDRQAGQKLDELEEDGVAGNTIVFFFSDHGGMLAGSKRYIRNGGLHVPLIVCFPEKWKHLAPAGTGGTTDRLVSFVDFPKTVLALAGAEIPALMQGRVFLGENTGPAPETVHFFRDRMAERPDFSRAVTDGRHLFVRNFMPHRPPGRDSRYGFNEQANWRAWEQHFEEGKCDPVQSRFFLPKAPTEFFDNQDDPWNATNVANQPQHKSRVDALSQELDRWMIETRDTGLIPEPLFAELAGPGKPFKTLYEYAQSDQYPVAELLQIAKDAATGDPQNTDHYIMITRHAHPVARYHGAYALFLTRSNIAAVKDALGNMIAGDPMPANRIMAAQALGRCGDPDTAYRALRREIDATRDGYLMLYALNALQNAHLDQRLTKEDWQSFLSKNLNETGDRFGADGAKRIITDAIELFPNRRRVD